MPTEWNNQIVPRIINLSLVWNSRRTRVHEKIKTQKSPTLKGPGTATIYSQEGGTNRWGSGVEWSNSFPSDARSTKLNSSKFSVWQINPTPSTSSRNEISRFSRGLRDLCSFDVSSKNNYERSQKGYWVLTETTNKRTIIIEIKSRRLIKTKIKISLRKRSIIMSSGKIATLSK